MGPGGRVPDEAVCVEPRHFACHHGESRDQSQSAAQSPEAVSLEALPYGAAPSRCASCATPGRCERRTSSGWRLSHRHRSRRWASTGFLLDLAGDAVPVPIQFFAISRITPKQGSCSRSLRLLAVGIVRGLPLRLRYGSGSRRTATDLSLLFRCRLWLGL